MNLKELQHIYPKSGTVEMLIIRPKRLETVLVLEQVEAVKEEGLRGDHYQNLGGSRQITLFQFEHLRVIASILESDDVLPQSIRRNIVVRGLNLLSLKGKRFSIGEAVFEYTGECHPCSRMEQALGTGGYNAMRGHGGITAKVIRTGLIKTGDHVHVLPENI